MRLKFKLLTLCSTSLRKVCPVYYYTYELSKCVPVIHVSNNKGDIGFYSQALGKGGMIMKYEWK